MKVFLYIIVCVTLLLALVALRRRLVARGKKAAGRESKPPVPGPEQEYIQGQASTPSHEQTQGHTPPEGQSPVKEQESSEMEDVRHRVECWLETRTYLKNDMTILRAQEEMGIDNEHLNRYLHECQHVEGYRQWIAGLRIEAAQQMMREHPEYSLEAVGRMCGFTERSNFSRAFKAYSGMTPRQWMEDNNMNNTNEIK